MKKIIRIAFSFVLFFSLIFLSCKKSGSDDRDTTGVIDHSNAETQSNDIVNIGSEASYGNMTNYRINHPDQVFAGCATIKFDTLINTNTDTLIVDFGAAGCTGLDGRTRKGVLWYIFTPGKHYRDSANVIKISTPGNTYFVDNNQVIINSKTVTNMGHVTNGMLTWSVSSDMSINLGTGKSIHWTSDKIKVLLAGEQPNHMPIKWSIAKIALFGSASGTSSNGSSFTVNVSQANWLVRDFTCGMYRKFFVSGILEFTPSGHATRYVNYGSGNCDDQAVVTISGQAYTITMH